MIGLELGSILLTTLCTGTIFILFFTIPFITWTFPASTLEISQIRGHRLGSSPPQLDRYVPFLFIARWVQLSLRSSTFIEACLLTHVVRFQRGRYYYRSSFSIENSHPSETRTQETFHQESCSYSHMTIMNIKSSINSIKISRGSRSLIWQR